MSIRFSKQPAKENKKIKTLSESGSLRNSKTLDSSPIIEPKILKEVKIKKVEIVESDDDNDEKDELTSSNESLYSSEEKSVELSSDSDSDQEIDKDCSHRNTFNKAGLQTCEDCGIELYQEISLEQEWRFYGDRDTKNFSDPSRCQRRKTPEKGIKLDLERMGFPSDIAIEANRLYMIVTKDEVKKNNLRKGVTFACLFEAYKHFNRHQVPEELRKKLDITRRCMSKGLIYYRRRCNREEISTDTITPRHYVPAIMETFNIKQTHIDNVIKLCTKMDDLHSSILNRSTPENISIAIVFYYLRSVGADIGMENYSKTVHVSTNILQKLSTEINRLLGTDINLI